MAYWLFKEEPTSYGFADLTRDGRSVWDGIANPQALKNLRAVRAGDRVFFYATGGVKAVVGEMRVVRGPQTPEDDPKAVSVEVEPVAALVRPVTLAAIKGEAALAGWDLVRLPRLSVVPVTESQWKRVQEMSEAEAGAALGRTPKAT
ncbi:MAG: EVE domain-containing protein [Gemmataceae bacterium]